MTDRITTGARGEELAADFLHAHGFELLDRNWRCRFGEIDLIAREGRALVCVEVRSRTSTGFGHPVESITRKKLARMRQVAAIWRAAHPDLRGGLRLDVVTVMLLPGQPPEIAHLRGVGGEDAR